MLVIYSLWGKAQGRGLWIVSLLLGVDLELFADYKQIFNYLSMMSICILSK